MELKDFKSKTRIQLRFRDTDQMGHVNNANHLTYFELARMNYFKEVITDKINWTKEGIILAHIEVDYKSPILLEDELWVYTRVISFGRSSFEMEYKVIRGSLSEGMLAAEGKSVQVCFNYEINRTVPVPEAWKEKVIAFEPCTVIGK